MRGLEVATEVPCPGGTALPLYQLPKIAMALREQGVALTNQMPAKINGKYYIHYVGKYAWSHLEAN